MPESLSDWKRRHAQAQKYFEMKYGRRKAFLAMASWMARPENKKPDDHSFKNSYGLVLPQSSRGDTFYGGGHHQHFNLPR